ncbi:MAG: retropepsin-like domain-containing protein [Planctomycetia bacterium]|nr:retropepsin-like domain-containing protein [Planctomycetia bacterium]
MAIIHVQFSCKIVGPDGKPVPGPPSQALQNRGPTLQASLGLSQSFAAPLLERGEAVPAPISGFALLDTGASNTCIDDAAAKKLGLPVIDVAKLTSASHSDTPVNVYPAHIELLAGANIAFDVDRAMGAALDCQGLLVLIGRDFLQSCTLFYNGPAGQITLSAG